MAVRTEELFLNVGPQHPSTHGVLRLGMVVEGERIVSVDPDIGYLHRGMEKISEIRSYIQFQPFTDRLDYLASMSNNLAYALTVEKLLNIEIPRRAEYIRVIVVELNRIASHLVWLGAFANDLGAVTPLLYCFREREQILDLYEMICGARLTYTYVRIGGVFRDVTAEFVDGAQKFLSTFEDRVDEYETLLTKNPIFVERTRNIGILSPEDAVNWGASGPMIRGSGIRWDLRKVDGYSVYPELRSTYRWGKPPMIAGTDTWCASSRCASLRESCGRQSTGFRRVISKPSSRARSRCRRARHTRALRRPRANWVFISSVTGPTSRIV